jgi:hypothetical protein
MVSGSVRNITSGERIGAARTHADEHQQEHNHRHHESDLSPT